MNYAVILIGDAWRNFWPESRANKPNAFMSLDKDQSLIQRNVSIINTFIPYENILIVTNSLYIDLIKEQLPNIKNENIVLAPTGKRVSECIALACAFIAGRDVEASIAVFPSSYIINSKEDFKNTILYGINKVKETDWIVTIGIEPNLTFSCSYMICDNLNSENMRKVNSFMEKPTSEMAQNLIKDERALLISGVFMFSIKTIMKIINRFCPDVFMIINKIKNAENQADKDFIQKGLMEFQSIEYIRDIYYLMRYYKNVYAISQVSQFYYMDWNSLESLGTKDEDGNIILGKVISTDTHNSIIRSKKKLIATIDIENLVIVETDDIILICKRDSTYKIGKILDKIKETNMDMNLKVEPI